MPCCLLHICSCPQVLACPADAEAILPWIKWFQSMIRWVNVCNSFCCQGPLLHVSALVARSCCVNAAFGSTDQCRRLSPPNQPCWSFPCRRRPFLVKALENVLQKFVMGLEFYDDEGRHKIAIGEVEVEAVGEACFSRCGDAGWTDGCDWARALWRQEQCIWLSLAEVLCPLVM